MSKIAQNVTKSNTSASATKMGPRKIMRIQGCLGPSWAIYRRELSDPEAFCGTRAAAIEIAKAYNSSELAGLAIKTGLKRKVARIFWEAQNDESGK